MQKKQDPVVTDKMKKSVSALFDSARKPSEQKGYLQSVLRPASYLALSAMIGLGSAACAKTTANAVQGTKEPVIAGYSIKATKISKGGAAMHFKLPKTTGAEAEVNLEGEGFSLVAGVTVINRSHLKGPEAVPVFFDIQNPSKSSPEVSLGGTDPRYSTNPRTTSYSSEIVSLGNGTFILSVMAYNAKGSQLFIDQKPLSLQAPFSNVTGSCNTGIVVGKGTAAEINVSRCMFQLSISIGGNEQWSAVFATNSAEPFVYKGQQTQSSVVLGPRNPESGGFIVKYR
jgi:hypothetical protein